MYKTLTILAALLTLTACSGRIYTVQNPTFVNGQTEGVLFYGYKVREKKVLLDRIRHPKTGNISHSSYVPPRSPEYCRPRIKVVKEVVADFDTLYAIKYDPQLFETSKFSVELDKGMLKSVNSESTPGPKAAVETLQGLVDIRADLIGAVEAAEASSQDTMALNIFGDEPAVQPLPCSTNE